MTDLGKTLPTRLDRQIQFVLEIDGLKTVLRQTLLVDGSRRENSAEHSWHLALLALILEEHADRVVDIRRVLEMVLVHDLVEIDAGDTFCYDEDGNVGRPERERLAANRLFGLLPAEQGARLMGLWEEFEARESPDAKYAAALDRIQPLLANLSTGGHSWQQHGVTRRQVDERARPIADASAALWEYMKARLDEAVENGLLEP